MYFLKIEELDTIVRIKVEQLISIEQLEIYVIRDGCGKFLSSY